MLTPGPGPRPPRPAAFCTPAPRSSGCLGSNKAAGLSLAEHWPPLSLGGLAFAVRSLCPQAPPPEAPAPLAPGQQLYRDLLLPPWSLSSLSLGLALAPCPRTAT